MPPIQLNLTGAYVPLIRPLLPRGNLESIALPFHAADIHLLMKHPALKYLGYDIIIRH